MTPLAPYLSSFLREHLPKERRASQHTCEAYAQAFQLLLCFAARRLMTKPARIEIERLDAPLILAFLEHLEGTRGNSSRTRNVRLAEAPSFGLPALKHDSTSRGALAYLALAGEVLRRGETEMAAA